MACVSLNAYQTWLSKILENKARGRSIVHVHGLVGDLPAALKSSLSSDEASSPNSDDSQAKASDSEQPARAGAIKGQAASGLEEDSDEEEFLQDRPAKRLRASRRRADFQTVKVHGLGITAKQRYRGRGVVIPLGGESVLSL